MRYLNRFLAMSFVCVLAGTAVADEELPPREPKQTVPRSEAVEALRTFQEDPLHNLEAASVFTTYVKEDGNIHVSMNEQLVPWMMNRTVPQRTKAILLSAFIAGNFQAQLDDESKLDDSAAGLTYTVEIYERLKQEDPTLMVAELDNLLAAKHDGELQVAIQDMLTDGESADQ